MSNLNARQLAFVAAYIECGFNATEAAKKAGYSEATARQQGSRLLTNVDIRNKLNEQMSSMTMPSSEVLFRLSQHASTDMADFIKIQAGLPFIDLERAQTAAKLHQLKKFKVTKQGVEIELYDAQAALVQLGRHYGLFTDKLQVDDWRSQAIADIKTGRVRYQDLADAFDSDLATELFAAAGIPVSNK